MIKSERISFRRIRMDRLATRRVFYAFLALLAVVVVYRAFYPPKQVIVERPAAGAPDLPAQAFARDFTAAFLAYDTGRLDRRAAALEPFTGGSRETWGYSPPSSGARTVRETAVEQVYPKPDGVATYVVAAHTSTGLMHLSVNVGRRDGALQILGYPAIVGGVARTNVAGNIGGGVDVDDDALRTVVERALKNWFSHQTTDLDADLSPDAEISLPDQTYELGRISELVDAQDGSVRATVVVVSRAGEELTLTYEINVEKRADRWTVSAIQTLPGWH